jgi:hypothetical protein
MIERQLSFPSPTDVSLVYQNSGAEVTLAADLAVDLGSVFLYRFTIDNASMTSFTFQFNVAGMRINRPLEILIGYYYLVSTGITLNGATSVEIPANAYGHLFGHDYDELLDLDNTSDIRCGALSLLATFMGSSLENGGLIAGARIPRGVRVWDLSTTTDFYTAMTRLTRDSKDFPLKKGCYTWWLPAESQDKDFTHASERRQIYDETTLWMTMVRDDPLQTVRIKAVQVVEFLTSLPTYSIATSISDVHLSDQLSLASAKLPAVTENDLHDWLKSTAGKAFKALNRELRSPAFWESLASKVIPLMTGL